MEPRGKRGSRAPDAAAAPAMEPVLPAAPEITSQMADDSDSPDRDSPVMRVEAEAARAVAAARPDPSAAPQMPDHGGPPGGDSLAAFAEMQTVLARGFEALSAELAGLARSGLESAAHLAIRLLAVRTWSDAVALQADCAGSALEAVLAGPVRLSHLGVRLAAEAAEPLLAQSARGWSPAADRVC
jgi:hypothetical protein